MVINEARTVWGSSCWSLCHDWASDENLLPTNDPQSVHTPTKTSYLYNYYELFMSYPPPFFFLFQGFEDCLVFDELMDKFNNDLSKYTFSGAHRLAQMISCGPVYDPGTLITSLP